MSGLLPEPEEVEFYEKEYEDMCLRLAENPPSIRDIHDYDMVYSCWKTLLERYPEKAQVLRKLLDASAENVAKWCVERVKHDDWGCEDMVLCNAFSEVKRHIYEISRRDKRPYHEQIEAHARSCEEEKIATAHGFTEDDMDEVLPWEW